ncbi:sugar ABC transporter permease [Mycoplasma sp. E35C]|uniref:sugar ABC transporter permease n=1 Tax=Mycoplasma sp. E35C TaxID=2801918 RepID=UPI001CA3EE60|nr:sugar ABC transporter permease [Mycoplasma sp. E35C]QZX49356.1 sugar ABC transporter permease [Mycoplasma sp. E35C]
MLSSKKRKFRWNIKNDIIGLTLNLPIILLVIILTFLPIILSIIDSFKVNLKHSLVRYNFGIGNFQQLARDSQFKSGFINTNIIIFAGVPGVILLGFIFAIILNEISSKMFKNVAIVALFSQFFTSAFAIGFAFIFLFGSHYDGFNKIFGTNFRFTNDQSPNNRNVLLVYFIFYFWRMLPFNVVMMTFSFSRSLERYSRVMKIDKIKFHHKLWYVYLKNFKAAFWLVLYVNFLNAALFYPGVIIEGNTPLSTINGNTLASYLFETIRSTESSLNPYNPFKAAAVNVIILLYLLGITLIFFIIKRLNVQTITNITNKLNKLFKPKGKVNESN